MLSGATVAYGHNIGRPAGFLFQLSSKSSINTLTYGWKRTRKVKSMKLPIKRRQCQSISPLSPFLQLKQDSTEDEKYISTPIESIMADMEKEVWDSAQANLDIKRVKEAFMSDSSGSVSDDAYYNSSPSSMTVLDPSNPISSDVPRPSQWRIALAAGFTASLISFLLLKQPILSFAFFLVTTIVAARDPLDEKSFLTDGEDDIAGPLARLIGRATLQSIEESTPKVRAITKAAVTGGAEIDSLKVRIRQLEEENRSLALWVERRMYIDEHIGKFKLEQLKDRARREGLAVGGTKMQLMMRLAEAGYLEDLI